MSIVAYVVAYMPAVLILAGLLIEALGYLLSRRNMVRVGGKLWRLGIALFLILILAAAVCCVVYGCE